MHLRFGAFAFIFLIVVLFSQLRLFGATFSSTAMSEVSAANMTGEATATFVFTNAPPPDGATTMSAMGGTGMVSTLTFSNDPSLTGGTQSASVAGSATSPPLSFAFAASEVHDFVEVFNNNGGSSDAVLEFTFDYSASSSVFADPGDEAVAHYNIHITGADDEVGELLEVSVGAGPFVAVSDFEVSETLFASLGDVASAVSDTITVRYTASPFGTVIGGETADGEYAFSIFTRADGAAQAPAVPEPTSIALWGLIGLGIAGFGYSRVRRRKNILS